MIIHSGIVRVGVSQPEHELDSFEGSEVAPMGTRVVQADAPEETRSLVAAAPPAVDTLQKAARVLEILEADLPSLSSAEFEQGCAEAGIPKLQQLLQAAVFTHEPVALRALEDHRGVVLL